MNKPADVDYLYYKITQSFEHGLYKVAEKNHQGFLLFVFTSEEAAKKAGEGIGKLFGVEFRPTGPKIRTDKDGWPVTQLNSQIG